MQGVAASQVVVEEAGAPVMLMLRLKIANRTITEVETQVTRNQKEGAIFAVDALRSPNAAMIAPVNTARRSSRAEAIRLYRVLPRRSRGGKLRQRQRALSRQMPIGSRTDD